MGTDKKIFVFVVCGGKEHIHTLHVSLRALLARTKHAVWVVTDSLRNEEPVSHTHIVDVRTPETFDHHQASIYLKTGLHRFLPKGNLYCYLDTDVVALDSRVDDIFNRFSPPVTFAPDAYPLSYFSPFAVNCGCLHTYREAKRKYFEILADEKRELQALREAISDSKRSRFGYFFHRVRYALPVRFYVLDRHFRQEKSTSRWQDGSGEFLDEKYIRQLGELDALVRHGGMGQAHVGDAQGNFVLQNRCGHLRERIREKFDTEIPDPDWQHWNGGVFLFSDHSEPFMEYWHRITLQIFDDEKWKTRDQGTLVATVYKFGMENHAVLGPEWNCILDYHNPRLAYDTAAKRFTLDGNTYVDARLVHVFYYFGDTSWPVWNHIQARLTQSS